MCELEQLTGQQLTACINDEAFTIDGGFCYSQVPVIVGPQCQKLGAPGTIRFFGGSRARNGSELFTQCGNPSGCP